MTLTYFTPFFFGVVTIVSTGGVFSACESDSSWAFLSSISLPNVVEKKYVCNTPLLVSSC